jgi:hypothetical protein
MTSLTVALAGCQGPSMWRPPVLFFGVEAIATSQDTEPAMPVPITLTGRPMTAPAMAPSRSPATGGGSSGHSPYVGRVLDEREQPVAGATVVLADGRSTESGADGRFTFTGGRASGAVVVSAASHVTSLVWDAAAVDTFHLRRTRALTPPFDLRTVTVTGRVVWPDDDHEGGVVYYQDSLGSTANPIEVAADGSFAVSVISRAPGSPRATVLVLAANAAGDTLVGLARPFAPFEGETVGDVTMVVADQAIDFAVEAVPDGLSVLRSRLEFLQDDGPTVTLAGPDAAAGTLKAPAAGRLPGGARLVVEAAGPGLEATSLVAMPATGGQLRDSFLPVPTFDLDVGARRVTWSAVPQATGYRLESRSHAGSVPMWEGWSLAPAPMTLPDACWPAPDSGDLMLEAIDASAISTRRVAQAGPLRLRVAPWSDEPRYRASSLRRAL